LRAYQKLDHCRVGFIYAVEKAANSSFTTAACSRWFGYRLDLFLMFVAEANVLFSIFSRNSISHEALGFSLVLMLDQISYFQLSVRMVSETINLLNSFNRLVAYTNIESEDELAKLQDRELNDKRWPE